MSTLTSIPMLDPKRFLVLQDRYKQELMGDQRLEEASEVAAHRQMLLENKTVDPDWAVPQVKAMSRKLNRLTRRIRQPFGATPRSADLDEDDTADDFEAGPVQAMVKHFLKPTSATMKQTPANKPVRKRLRHSPVVTPSPRRPPKPATPLTGFELLHYGDYEDTPEAVIDRSYRWLFPHGESPVGARRASPQYALASPPPVSRKSTSPLPRTPILTRPFPRDVLTAPPADYPFVVRSRQPPQQVAKGTKRKNAPPPGVEFGTKGPKVIGVDKRALLVQRAKKKAKREAPKETTKVLKNWLKFK